MAIEVGDVVKLNSGGPRLTVSAVDGDKIRVGWFDAQPSGGFELKFATVFMACLRKIESRQGTDWDETPTHRPVA